MKFIAINLLLGTFVFTLSSCNWNRTEKAQQQIYASGPDAPSALSETLVRRAAPALTAGLAHSDVQLRRPGQQLTRRSSVPFIKILAMFTKKYLLIVSGHSAAHATSDHVCSHIHDTVVGTSRLW